jgi:hypothetical protein
MVRLRGYGIGIYQGIRGKGSSADFSSGVGIEFRGRECGSEIQISNFSRGKLGINNR